MAAKDPLIRLCELFLFLSTVGECKIPPCEFHLLAFALHQWQWQWQCQFSSCGSTTCQTPGKPGRRRRTCFGLGLGPGLGVFNKAVRKVMS